MNRYLIKLVENIRLVRSIIINSREFTSIKIEKTKQKVPIVKVNHNHEDDVSKDGALPASCGPENTGLDEENEMENMFVNGPAGMEWGGPTRGGQRPEPTRFGDWERKGRASDF